MLESRDKKERVEGAKKLGSIRTKASLRALLESAETDNEKDVRKAAIDSIGILNDPEAVDVLERIAAEDRDRGVKKAASETADSIRSSGTPLPETDFSESDVERSRDDYRALEEHEAKQPGLQVKINENLRYRIDRENNIIDEEGNPAEKINISGKIAVMNTGMRDRIWGIDVMLKGVDEVEFHRDEEQEIAVFGNSFGIKELDPQKSVEIPFDFQLTKPRVKITENFWDLEKPDSPPMFSRGIETSISFIIEVSNENDFPLKEIELKKYMLDADTVISNFQADQGQFLEDTDDSGRMILWTIDEIPAYEQMKASCEMKVTLPEDASEPYAVGDTLLTYHCLETSLSSLDLETITGSSSVFQYITRDEQEESPGDFDCQFELENTSEFEMDLKEIRIYEGSLEEGNTRLEWLGKDFPEEERSIDPGETFKLDPWTITVEEENIIPQFGRNLDLSVKYLFDADVVAECTLPGYSLAFMDFQANKTFALETVPSFKRSEIMTENVIKSNGSTEIQFIQLQDTIPIGFEAPSKDRVEIVKADRQLSENDFELEIQGNELFITIEHLEATWLESLKQDEEMIVKYPFFTVSPKPDDSFDGTVTILANIYPPVIPVSVTAEAGPITVLHERRKLKIGKMVRSTTNEDLNEYEIILRGVNEGTAVIHNVEVSDFLPKGFNLVSDTEEDPPVGFEEHESIKDGKAMKWRYDEIQPGQKVQIRFKIRAPGDHDPKDVYRMLLG
jgi:uncharacterized repeat protein (TIGR01451 family)